MGLMNLLDRLMGVDIPQITRSEEEQQKIDTETANLSLYLFDSCPFCIKVRHAIERLSLNIAYRNIHKNSEHAEALLKGGGMHQVPCLRIDNPDGSSRWLYESSDIVTYLQQRFSD